MDEPTWWVQYLVVGTFGALVGLTELFTRYRDAPRRLFGMLAFHLYWMANAAAATGTLLILRSGLVEVGSSTGRGAWLAQCLVAGLGAMLLLRSAFLIVGTGDGEQRPVGPGAIISALLDFVEDVVRRNQAEARSAAVNKHMHGVDYQKAAEALPRLCLALMASTSKPVVERIESQVQELKKDPLPDEAKVLLLGAMLIDFCGQGVLREAVATAGNVIYADAHTKAEPGLKWFQLGARKRAKTREVTRDRILFDSANEGDADPAPDRA
jgi:hypothetical protein